MPKNSSLPLENKVVVNPLLLEKVKNAIVDWNTKQQQQQQQQQQEKQAVPDGESVASGGSGDSRSRDAIKALVDDLQQMNNTMQAQSQSTDNKDGVELQGQKRHQDQLDDNESTANNNPKKQKSSSHDSTGPQGKAEIDQEDDEGKGESDQGAQPRTLKQLALFIVEKCKNDALLDQLRVMLRSDTFLRLKKNSTKEKLEADITGLDCDDIDLVTIGDVLIKKDCSDWDAKYHQVMDLLFPVSDLQNALQDLFKKNLELNGTAYDPDFVTAENPSQITGIRFPVDLSKGAAVVVTGESGSGKSWFATRYVPYRFQDACFIYCVLDDGDRSGPSVFEPEDKALGNVYRQALKIFEAEHGMGSEVYDAVAELSRLSNTRRNTAAVKKFKDMIARTLDSSSIATTWWGQDGKTKSNLKVEKLVIVLDEVGKNLCLARGLVDEVRTIISDISARGLADKTMLVLVGSGLEHFIGQDSSEYEVIDDDNDDAAAYRASVASYGTDPSKSNVVVLKGPNLEVGGKVCGIPVSDIMGGTYSRVLSTNTRMLMRGIIPIFQSEMNTLNVDNESERRIELGSTNIVMDYAVRVYILLNGLQRYKSNGGNALDKMLLKQFRLLLYGEIQGISKSDSNFANPAFANLPLIRDGEYDEVLRAGLITSDIKNTSLALRYLACKGQTAPLHAQDGIAFEIVLQHHLVRLTTAQYGRETEDDEQETSYSCVRYSLVEAWPPASTKKAKLGSGAAVKKEVMAKYENEKTIKRSGSDIAEIAKLIQGKSKVDLVLKQTVPNVQGADVMVLSKRRVGVFLDLYQAKHYDKLPSCNHKKIIGAFSSLGVQYDATNNELTMKPLTGSAGYSYLGTAEFVSKLSKKLGTTVEIRDRVVVFSCGWESFLKASSWKDFPFKDAKEKKVWIWSKEMLEPSISALVLEPAANDEPDDGHTASA